MITKTMAIEAKYKFISLRFKALAIECGSNVVLIICLFGFEMRIIIKKIITIGKLIA